MNPKTQPKNNLDIEHLDIEHHASLVAYLRRNDHIANDEEIFSRPLLGGVSNRTVWVERPDGETWVMKQALAKLRVQVDWFSDPRRVHREAAGIRWLSRLLPPGKIPTLIFEDHEEHILAMTAVPQPHHNWKHLLLEGKLEADHVQQFGHMLGQLHRKAFDEAATAAVEFADDSFFEALRLEPYYAYTATQVPTAAGFLNAIIGDTCKQKLTVVHGDYSPKNVLVYNDQLVLLDHEVIHFGDPAFDLGFSLTHFLGKAHHLPDHRDAFARAAIDYWQIYQQTLGDVPWAEPLEARAVRHTLACLLARVAGRSPFEYLDEAERARQQEVVVSLMADPPQQVAALVERFVDGL